MLVKKWLARLQDPTSVRDSAKPVTQAEAAPAAQRFKEIGDLNDFEKKLLEEVSVELYHLHAFAQSVGGVGLANGRLNTQPCLACCRSFRLVRSAPVLMTLERWTMSSPHCGRCPHARPTCLSNPLPVL